MSLFLRIPLQDSIGEAGSTRIRHCSRLSGQAKYNIPRILPRVPSRSTRCYLKFYVPWHALPHPRLPTRPGQRPNPRAPATPSPPASATPPSTAPPASTTSSATASRPASSLRGTEVKSIREGKANLKDAYGLLKDGELFLLNAHIGPFSHGNAMNHDALRTRKLLLHKTELRKLAGKAGVKGYTLIPTRLYFRNGPREVRDRPRQGQAGVG